MADVNGTARRRDRAARAIGAYDCAETPGPRPARVRDGENAGEAIGELLCDLHHLADEFDLDWTEVLARGERYHREEAARHVVAVTTEGFQILDRETESLRADTWGSRGDAQEACDALNRPPAGAVA